VAETLARDHRNFVGRIADGLLLGGWAIQSIPESGRLSRNRQLIHLECDGASLDLRVLVYSIGMTGRARDDERRIEITSTYTSNLRRLTGISDVVLGYDDTTGVFVGFDPRRLDEGGKTHNATSFFDRDGLTLAKNGPLVTLARPSQHFGTEYHAFFEPVRVAEYLFNRDDIHAGLYSGGGAFAGVRRRVGRRALKGPTGPTPSETLVLTREFVAPKAQGVDGAEVERSEKGSPPNRKTTPQKLQAILRKREENGILGEQHVVERERRRLMRAKRAELADEVRWVAREDVGLGYDVRSFETDGRDKFIEVKSTSGSSRQFEMSANEWRVAEQLRDRYCIARVTNIGRKPKVVEIRDPATLLEDGTIDREPASWRVEH
jgi:Protein NO VEIN, C-terminal/Methylase-associated X1